MTVLLVHYPIPTPSLPLKGRGLFRGSFAAVLLFLALAAARAEAATYYVDNGCPVNGDGSTQLCGEHGPFNSLARMAAKPGGYTDGDVIDGSGRTYYEVLAIPSGGSSAAISYQNFTIDGTYSFSGTNTLYFNKEWSFPPGPYGYGAEGMGNCGAAQPHGWTARQGANTVYAKQSTRLPQAVWEVRQGEWTELVPYATDLTTESHRPENVLPPGSYSFIAGGGILGNGEMYYRASDDADPRGFDGNPETGRDIRVTRDDYDSAACSSQAGLITIDGMNHVTLKNVTARRFKGNISDADKVTPAGFYVKNARNVTLDAVSASANEHGVYANGVTDFTVSNSLLIANHNAGLAFTGPCANVSVTGNTIALNGRVKGITGLYGFTGQPAWDYGGDYGPGIGFGYYVDGDKDNFTIKGNRVVDNGPDHTRSEIFAGYGIMAWTIAAKYLFNDLRIVGNEISGNHSYGLVLDIDSTRLGSIASAEVSRNLFSDNGHLEVSPESCQGTCLFGDAVMVRLSNRNSFRSFSFYNNDLVNNGGSRAALTVADWSGSYGAVSVLNNIFYNNGQAANFSADLFLPHLTDYANLTESNNLFARIGTSWQKRPVIRVGGKGYDLGQVIGNNPGYWQFDTGKGSQDRVGDPGFSAPHSGDFRLRENSCAVDAGLSFGEGPDLEGKPLWGRPDLGAYEFIAGAAGTSEPAPNAACSDEPPELAVSAPADGSYTNKATLSLSGSAASLNGLRSLTVNGVPLSVGADGTFGTSLSLNPGNNRILTLATDHSGASATDSRSITLDSVAPLLTLDPLVRAGVQGAQILTVSGTVDEPAAVSVTVNGGPALPASRSGNGYSASVPLSPGANSIVVRALDLAGNGASVQGKVIYDPVPLPSGDVNGDGALDLVDAVLALRMAVKQVAPTSEQLRAGDVAPVVGGVPAPDRTIDIRDVVQILRKCVGLESW